MRLSPIPGPQATNGPAFHDGISERRADVAHDRVQIRISFSRFSEARASHRRNLAIELSMAVFLSMIPH